ncbi:prolipoprotein diacylglyceryl transferase [Spirosoma radiotolerans]|uniref:Phosphatidylglycerol--prolipoprotein diacylglyceryl transferase n=1 Tax=Spirosoma radiotolerans TaxID=1379870 RepID=A0A0E3V5Z7_9BACT|nr:prolipoprotein diacylglyceryl transferase [Spirosoma radiotolerans]AKD54592.1 diacylglyceryl transferase [Spirosoma radiotolerans]
MLQYIIWNVDPEIFRIDSLPIRWYGLLFATGFLIGIQIMTHIFKTENRPLADTDSLLMTVVVSTILGARLGHFLFYEPYMFIQDPLYIITPPYNGLASHGGVLGIIIGLWLYSRRQSSQSSGQTFLWVSDRICIVGALAGAFIRFGNLMNSEIFGKPTDVPWAFVFLRNHEFSQVPRHPTQLYESLSYLILFIGLLWYWKNFRNQAASGTMLGISLVWIFGLRFVWEFFKENQVTFEDSMSLNMGQLLSIPAILLGLILLLRNFIRPTSLIPIALVIQSSSLCYQCDYQSALPDSRKVNMNKCEVLISETYSLKTRRFQDHMVKTKKQLSERSPLT